MREIENEIDELEKELDNNTKQVEEYATQYCVALGLDPREWSSVAINWGPVMHLFRKQAACNARLEVLRERLRISAWGL